MRYISVILSILALQITFGQEKTGSIILESELPIIAIDANNVNIPDEPKINVKMAVLNNTAGEPNILSNDFDDYNLNIGIEIRGQSSQYLYPKKSYGIETRDSLGENLNISILGLPEENDWVLYGPYGDKTLIRNKLAYDLAAKTMAWAPGMVFCELVIDETYRGVYLFGENIKRDKNRVDIAKLTENDISGDDLTGGYIMKIDKGEQDGITGWHSQYPPRGSSNGRIYIQYHYPKYDDILTDQRNYIQTYMKDFEDLLVGSAFNDPYLGFQAVIDVGSFVDFFIISELSKNIDAYRLSTFFYKDKDSKGGKLKMGPVWDFNLAFGNANYCKGEQTGGWMYQFNETCPGDYWQVPFWWERLLEDTYFQNRLRTRWVELRTGPFRNDSINNLINSYEEHLGPAINRNFSLWPIFGEWIWPNNFVGNNYQEEIDYLKTWIDDRMRFLDYYMPGQVITSTYPEIMADNLSIYPNPFTDHFTIDFQEILKQEIHLKVYDGAGRLIYEEDVASFPHRVKPGNIRSGFYYYTLAEVSSGKYLKGKLVKN